MALTRRNRRNGVTRKNRRNNNSTMMRKNRKNGNTLGGYNVNNSYKGGKRGRKSRGRKH